MSTPKIVKKPRRDAMAFWLDTDGALRCWDGPRSEDPRSAEQVAGSGEGWIAVDHDATSCGTTLAEVRRELESGG